MKFVVVAENHMTYFLWGVSDDNHLPTTYLGHMLGLAMNYHFSVSIPASNSAMLA